MPAEMFEFGGVSACGPAAGSPWFQITTPASGWANVTEIGFFLKTATSTCIALARNTATVGTASASSLGFSVDPYYPGASSATRVATAWSSAPASAAVLRRASVPATIGAGFIWTWDYTNPLVVAACSGLSFYTYGATAASGADWYIKWYE